MNQFCEMKGIKREFSVARTPQQNGIAERKNRTLIEAARTMFVDSKLPTTFWAEAVNIACYVLNRILVIKPHNKTPYELIHGRPPLIDFMKPFECPVTILNTKDHLGKFDEGYFIGYSVISKAMRVFNKRTRIVEETLNFRFLENAPNVKGNRPDWFFDVNSLSKSINYVPVVIGNQTNSILGTKDNIVAGPKDSEEDAGMKPTEVNESEASDKGEEDDQDKRSDFERLLQQENTVGPSHDNIVGPLLDNTAGTIDSTAIAFEEHLFACFSPFKNASALPHVPNVFSIDDTGIFGNAYDDVKEEVDMNNVDTSYTASDDYSNKENDQMNMLWPLAQNVFRNQKGWEGIGVRNKGKDWLHRIGSTPIEPNKALIKDEEADSVDVHLYRSMIGSLMYLTASRPDIMFAVCACTRFQVTPKMSHLHAVKRIFRYLKGSCQFLSKRLISWQCKKQTIVANSTTKAEYVAAANCCGQNPSHSQSQMADLKFFDQHNMDACLEKTEENNEFHQIVDFLSSFNSMKQIHAIVDDKAVVISESSVRSDLLFLMQRMVLACLTMMKFLKTIARWDITAFYKTYFSKRNLDTKKMFNASKVLQLFLNNQLKDLPKPFNDTYETPTHNKKVFSNMVRKSKNFSGKVTLLFDSMLVQIHAPEGEGSTIPPEPQPTPSTSQLNISEPQTESLQTETPPTVSHELQTEAHIEQITPSPSTYQRKQIKTQKHRRAKQVTVLPQTSVPLDHGADEAVHKEGVTAPRNHGGALAQTRSERVLEKPNEPPLPEGHTSRSGEGSMEHTFELMDTVPPTPHDSPLIGGYTPRSDEGRLKLKELMAICTKLSKQVLDLEKENDAQAVEILKLKQRVRKLERKRKSRISHPRRRIYMQVESSDDELDEKDFDDFDDDNMEDVEGETVHTATTGVSDVSAPVTTAGVAISTAEPKIPPTTAATAFMDEDLTIAQTLIKMKEEKAKEKGVAIKDVEDSPRTIRSITQCKTSFHLLIQKRESDAELAQRLLKEELAELDRAQKERQKQEEATSATLAKKKENRRWIDDFKPIDDNSQQQAESTKKRQRADSEKESSKKQKLEEDNDAEKEELRDSMDVVPIVKTLFEPNKEDEIWKNQQDYNLISWRLFDSCGVHVLLMNIGVAIHMMIEKKYPLTQEMLLRMLNRRLDVDYEMPLDLSKDTKPYIKLRSSRSVHWDQYTWLSFQSNVSNVRKVDIYFCKPDGLGKQRKLSFIMSNNRKTRKLQRLEKVHIEGYGPTFIASIRGSRYYDTVIEDCSRSYGRYNANLQVKCLKFVIMEYLVNISKRRAFWSLNEDILKITIPKTNTSYPLRKIRRIRACTHQRPQRNKAQYAVSGRCQYAVLEIWNEYNILEDVKRGPYSKKSPIRQYSEEEEAEAMAETMKQYMSKTRMDYGSGVARPKIEEKDSFELKGQFLKELRKNTFSGLDNKDANEHIEKVLEIVDLFHAPNITVDQLML
ncbi:putative ribonuclease H-like domain-containing protein [Tanacetum coccineum]